MGEGVERWLVASGVWNFWQHCLLSGVQVWRWEGGGHRNTHSSHSHFASVHVHKWTAPMRSVLTEQTGRVWLKSRWVLTVPATHTGLYSKHTRNLTDMLCTTWKPIFYLITPQVTAIKYILFSFDVVKTQNKQSPEKSLNEGCIVLTCLSDLASNKIITTTILIIAHPLSYLWFFAGQTMIYM